MPGWQTPFASQQPVGQLALPARGRRFFQAGRAARGVRAGAAGTGRGVELIYRSLDARTGAGAHGAEGHSRIARRRTVARLASPTADSDEEHRRTQAFAMQREAMFLAT